MGIKNIIKSTPERVWDSPTFMTWGSFVSKSVGIVLVLPLVLVQFSTEEISLWYLFATFISFQPLANFGFSPTFVRIISYAMAGCNTSQLKNGKGSNDKQPNIESIVNISGTMRVIFLRLALCYVALLAVGGSYALVRPISMTPDPNNAWIAWIAIVVASFIVMYGNVHSSYLQGINKVAILRRSEMICSLGSILTMFLVLLLNGRILQLVMANQLWQVITVVVRKWLCLKYRVEKNAIKGTKGVNRVVFGAAWPSAWRSGLGIITSYGLVQVSGIIYAQIGTVESVASYLLGLRLIRIVSDFSRAPFYSKLPLFARLYSKGDSASLIDSVKRSMFLSYLSYIFPFIGLGFLGKILLECINSNAEFPSNLLWLLLGISFFIERYGAMHIQLYSLSNKIIWHIANAVSGLIYIVVSVLLFKPAGVYAFPIGFIAGNMGFYAWYSAIHSYRLFPSKFITFEKKTVLPAILCLMAYSIYVFALEI